jgi:DNA-binding winged helix-turn-helix (wHTH) protein
MRWKIGGFEFDALTGYLSATSDHRLNDKDTAVLRFLIENFGKRYLRWQLIAEVWGTAGGGDDNLYHSVSRLRAAFGGELESYIASRPYRLVKRPAPLAGADSIHELSSVAAPQAAQQATEPVRLRSIDSVRENLLSPNPDGKSSGTGSEPKFILSIDGIIPNSVGELIYEKVSEETIAECSSSYQRALEDFAFALVYGSQIRARWPWQADGEPGKESELEPAQLVISTLPEAVYEQEVFDDDLKATPFLAGEDNLNQIRLYIRSMGQCLQDAFFARLSRDLIVREAATYFGIHDSLFQLAKDPSDYLFGKNYYRHILLEEVPPLIGASGFKVLLDFVPEYPHKRWADRANDKYEDEARVRFVTEVVLTHLATMHQFEKNAERHRMWRMPYALRAEVTKQASRTGMQRQLRNVVVRHALLYALRNVSRIDRKELIIGILASIRGVHPFNMIREMLEELSLLQFEPDMSRENRARTLGNGDFDGT